MMNIFARFSVFLTLALSCLTATPSQAQTDGIPCRARAFLGADDQLSLANSAEIHGTTAYLATFHGLRIVDVSDPSSPVLLGSYNTTRDAVDVTVDGTLAYLATGLDGLNIVDVSDPSSPVLVSNLPRNFSRGVELSDDILYLSDSDFGLQLIDVSDPSSPTEIGDYDANPGNFGGPRGVVVEDDLVYAMFPGIGLRILDVSDPTNPALMGGSTNMVDYFDLQVVGTTAYASAQNDGLFIFDVSNPASPSLLGSYSTQSTSLRLAISEGFAYIAVGEYGIEVVDVSDPTSPAYYGYIDNTLENAQGVSLAGNIAYICDREAGLQIYDVTHAATPFIGGLDTPDDARAIAGSGTTLYVADYDSGLLIYDISDPTSPALAGSFTDLDNATGVAVDGTTVYLSTQGSGFKVLDASDPSDPVLIGSLPASTTGTLLHIQLRGTTADVLTAGSSGSFHNIDVSDPTNPTLLRTSFSTQSTGGVAIDGSTAYVAAGNLGYVILDITEPGFDTWLSNYDFADTNDQATDVEYMGTTLFGTFRDSRSGRNNYGGFVVVDASDPSNPTMLASLPTPGDALSLSMVGNIACVAYDGSYDGPTDYIRIGGLALFDVSDPADPVALGVWEQNEDSDATYVSVDGTTAYLANGQFGFAMIDVSDCPTCPADLNNDNTLNFFDVSVFLAAYSGADPIADFTGDGNFDFFDVSAFLSAFNAGCP